MRWQELTWPRFAQAVMQAGGVCLLPVGVVIPHGRHLPLGTDYLALDAIAARAAEIEPAIVFPPYYFGFAARARHRRGTIALRHGVLIQLLHRVSSEIARNGLRKIILVSRYWGTRALLQDFAQATLHAQRPYVIYLVRPDQLSPASDPTWQKMRATEGPSFAGEEDTSLMLALYPGLVTMEEVPQRTTASARPSDLAGVQVAVQSYADQPDLYTGGAEAATRQKGEHLLKYTVDRLAKAIAAVKADTKAADYLRRYYCEAADPLSARASGES